MRSILLFICSELAISFSTLRYSLSFCSRLKLHFQLLIVTKISIFLCNSKVLNLLKNWPNKLKEVFKATQVTKLDKISLFVRENNGKETLWAFQKAKIFYPPYESMRYIGKTNIRFQFFCSTLTCRVKILTNKQLDTK